MVHRPVVLALAAAALFGASSPAGKWLLGELSPLQLAGFLYLGAALGVLPAARGRRLLPIPPDRANRRRLVLAIFFGGVVGPLALLSGLRLAAAGSVALWLNLEMAATAVLGVWLFRDHLGRLGWIGVLTALGAAALLSIPDGRAGITAGMLVLLACVSWGLDNHFTALIDGLTPAQSTLWKGAVAGSVNLLAGLLTAPLTASVAVIGGALVVGALAYGLSIVLYITSAQELGATRAQVLFSTAPLFGVGLAAMWLHEPITLIHLGAAALFGVAIALFLAESHSHVHSHEPLAHQHAHRHDDGHHNHLHPGLLASTRHSHWHEHHPVTHAHAHWPDLHHRHAHAQESKETG